MKLQHCVHSLNTYLNRFPGIIALSALASVFFVREGVLNPTVWVALIIAGIAVFISFVFSLFFKDSFI